MFTNFLILMTTLMATLVHANDQAPSVGDTCGWFSESQFTSYTATCKWSQYVTSMYELHVRHTLTLYIYS
jgi:hypothetical protein